MEGLSSKGKLTGQYAVLTVLPIIHNGTVWYQVTVQPINDKGTFNW